MNDAAIRHGRRQLLRLAATTAATAAATAGGAWATLARAAGPNLSAALPYPSSLAEALASALRGHNPLVVMVSLEGCPFCKSVRDSYLAPLWREGVTPVVQVDVRSPMPIVNFQGVATTHDQLTRSWNIKVAPTVLFFGANGREVAPRLNGTYLPDFYGGYLDDRLAQARKALPV